MTDDLLERLEAAVAAAQLDRGEVPHEENQAALEALEARQKEAWEALAAFGAWVDQGSEVMARLWDRVEDADSVGLVDLLRLLTNREAGLMSALALLQRHVEASLGDRHGRTAIMDGDVAVAAVERSAASTRWDVESAWPEVGKAVRAAERLPIGDPEDGELEDDTARALRIVKQLAGVSYLRVEACRELGIDPDDYRTKSGWRWVVKLP